MRFYELSEIISIDSSYDHSVAVVDLDIEDDDDGDRMDVDGLIHIELSHDEKHVDVMDDDELECFDICNVDIIQVTSNVLDEKMLLLKDEDIDETEKTLKCLIDVEHEVEDFDTDVDEIDEHEMPMIEVMVVIHYTELDDNDDIWIDGMNTLDILETDDVLCIEMVVDEVIQIVTDLVDLDEMVDGLFGEIDEIEVMF